MQNSNTALSVSSFEIKERLSKHILADGYNMVMDVEKSHGNYIVDKNTGETYLDMFTMFASTCIGYNHPHLVKNAQKIGKLAITKPTLSDVYTEEYADCIDTFGRIAIPEYLQYAFFVEGGSLAVENGLKAAFDWKTKLNFQKGISNEADVVIHFKQAFHGRSGYTLSLTNTSDPRKYQYFPKFNWPRITNPKLYFPITDENLKTTLAEEEIAKNEIEIALKEFENRIACIIIEPLQGEGGDNFFRKEFHQYLRTICNENDILLMYDEVQCGMGITGKMWAHQHYDIQPDILSFGKKTQVCGILANKEKFDKVENNVFIESSRLNSTFGGNYVDFLRLKLIMEVYENENIVENARIQGEYLLQKIKKLQQEFPEIITNARGIGLWCSFDFPTAEIRTTFIKKCFESKLILLVCGDTSIRFRPHLNVSKSFIDECFEIIHANIIGII